MRLRSLNTYPSLKRNPMKLISFMIINEILIIDKQCVDGIDKLESSVSIAPSGHHVSPCFSAVESVFHDEVLIGIFSIDLHRNFKNAIDAASLITPTLTLSADGLQYS